jgi:ankyrin repeat protein
MKKKSNSAKERPKEQVAGANAESERLSPPSSSTADTAPDSTSTDHTPVDQHLTSAYQPESDGSSNSDLCAPTDLETSSNLTVNSNSCTNPTSVTFSASSSSLTNSGSTSFKCKKVKLDHLSKSVSASNVRASCSVCASGPNCSCCVPPSSQQSSNDTCSQLLSQSAAMPSATSQPIGQSRQLQMARRSTPPGASHPAFARRAPIATMCTHPGCQCQASVPAATPLSTGTSEVLSNGSVDALVSATLPSESADHPTGNQEDELACIDYALSDACTDTYVAEVKKIIREKRMTGQDSLLLLACCNGYYELAQFLLSTKVNIEERGSNDMTPLMEAASSGYANIVQLLLDHGVKLDAQTPQGNTALIYACANGCLQVVTVLLKYAQRLPNMAAFIEASNENGHTALMEAASAGHVEIAKHLVACNASINTHSNSFKESALTLACYKGNLEMVRFLLEAGADHEHKTEEMHTALMEASMDGHLEVARLLIESGARVNMPVDSFESPLTLAACAGHVELALLLLENGANIEEVNDEGYTPLMEGAREGHEEMVALLLSQGSDINVQTEDAQETALTLACCGGFIDVADFLIRAGADIEAGATTSLMEAAQEGHLDLCNMLLFHGANINACSLSGDTALMYASENDHAQVVKLLLASGADIEAEAEGGRTALMKAARAGHLNTVHALVEHGADVNRATASNDHTALSLACVAGHKNVVQYLLMNNANYNYRLKDNSTMLIEAAKGGHVDIVKVLMDFSNGIERMCGQLVVQELNSTDQQVPQSSQAHSQPLPLTPVMRQHAQQQLQQAFVQQLQQQHSQPPQPQMHSHLSSSSQNLVSNLDSQNVVQQSHPSPVSLKKNFANTFHPQPNSTQQQPTIVAQVPQYVAPSASVGASLAKSIVSEQSSSTCGTGRAKRPRASRQLSDPTLEQQRASSTSVCCNASTVGIAHSSSSSNAISPSCLTNMLESNLADFKNQAVLNAAAYESWMYSTLNEMGEGNREAIYQAGLALGRRHILQETERLEQCINHMMRRTEQLNPSREEQIKQKQQILDELHRVEKELQERAQIQLIISQLKQHKQHLQAIYSSHHAHCQSTHDETNPSCASQSADSIASQFLNAIEAVSDSQIVKDMLIANEDDPESQDINTIAISEDANEKLACDLHVSPKPEGLTEAENEAEHEAEKSPLTNENLCESNCENKTEYEQTETPFSHVLSDVISHVQDIPKMKKRNCLDQHQKQLRDKMSEFFGFDSTSGDAKEFLKKAVHEFKLDQHFPLILPQLYDRLNEVEQALQSGVEHEIAQRKKSVAKRRINKTAPQSPEQKDTNAINVMNSSDKSTDTNLEYSNNQFQNEQETIEHNLIPIVEPFYCEEDESSGDEYDGNDDRELKNVDTKIQDSASLILEPYGTKIKLRTHVPLDYTGTNQRYSRESQTLVTSSSGVFQICLGLDLAVESAPVTSVSDSSTEPQTVEMIERTTQTVQYNSNEVDESDKIAETSSDQNGINPPENSMDMIRATFDWSVAMRLALYAAQPIGNQLVQTGSATSTEIAETTQIADGSEILYTDTSSDGPCKEIFDEAVMKALVALDGLERMEQVLRENKSSETSSDVEIRSADEKLRQKWARLKWLKKQYLLSVKQCENVRNQTHDENSLSQIQSIDGASTLAHSSQELSTSDILTDSNFNPIGKYTFRISSL